MAINKPSAELLLDLININAAKKPVPTEFEAGDFTFENPETMPYDAKRNTSVVLTPAGASGKLSKPTRVFYNRVRLSDLNEGDVLDLPDEGFTSTEDLLEAINTLFSAELQADDIVVAAIPAGALPKGVTLAANPNSLGYIGQLQIQLIDAG